MARASLTRTHFLPFLIWTLRATFLPLSVAPGFATPRSLTILPRLMIFGPTRSDTALATRVGLGVALGVALGVDEGVALGVDEGVDEGVGDGTPWQPAVVPQARVECVFLARMAFVPPWQAAHADGATPAAPEPFTWHVAQDRPV